MTYVVKILVPFCVFLQHGASSHCGRTWRMNFTSDCVAFDLRAWCLSGILWRVGLFIFQNLLRLWKMVMGGRIHQNRLPWLWASGLRGIERVAVYDVFNRENLRAGIVGLWFESEALCDICFSILVIFRKRVFSFWQLLLLIVHQISKTSLIGRQVCQRNSFIFIYWTLKLQYVPLDQLFIRFPHIWLHLSCTLV